jgi:hypothetical protein
MTEVTWEDPPPARSRKSVRDWHAVAATLRTRPSEWALVVEKSRQNSTAHFITHGRIAAFRPEGMFQGRSAKNDDGTFRIFARYVGEQS